MKEEDIKKIIHAYPRNVYGELGTRAQGLTDEEIRQREAKYGKNEITKEKKTPLWKVFIENFISPMAIMLWVAGILALISAFISEETPQHFGPFKDPQMFYLSIAIWLVNIVNGIFSFMQQFKAGKMTDALAKMLPQYARVIRNGEEIRISASDLVPGDIMILAEGDRISADARILMCDDLTCTQSALDGEATPSRKTHEPLKEEPDSLVGAKNLVFAGTSVSTGSARCVVIATGMDTEFGKIASLTQNIKPKKSPLQKEIDRATKTISIIALTVGAIVFILGILVNGIQKEIFNQPSLYLTQFVFALGMIVAFIPEGLSPTVTLSLAKAVQRIAKDGALIKSLTSVETLGSATVICSDKTGTLTKNEMTVKSIYLPTGVLTVTGNGYNPEGHIVDAAGKEHTGQNDKALKKLLTIGGLCSDARLIPPDPNGENKHYTVLGDPTEACLGVAAEKGLVSPGNQLNLMPRIRELNFDSVRKMMSTIHQLDRTIDGAQRIAMTKGAPKEVLEKCSYILDGENVRPITDEDRKKAMAQNDSYARDGLRVLAMAYRLLKKDGEGIPLALSDYTPEIIEQNMVFVGLEAMQDPPREGIKEAITQCHRAGIKVIMVTGDYGLTALAIAKKIGIVRSDKDVSIITGLELSRMDDATLKEKLKGEVIFARMAPEQKYRVVTCLQELGEIVAVTGDGVNDAPALKKADIGVAMGITGTDVAKDAADMILTDDNFASIVKAIMEGRTVYDNIKKFITYIFNSNVPEAIPFLLPTITGNLVPQPLTIMEVLFIDLGTDLVPALGLGSELPNDAVMDQKPRSRDSHIIDKRLLGRAGIYGLMTSALAMAAYFLFNLFSSQANGLPYTLFGNTGNINDPETQLWMQSTAVVLTSIVFCQIGMGFNCRTDRDSVFKLGLFSNRLLLIGQILEVVLVLAITFIPWVNAEIFQANMITSWQTWLILVTFPFIVFFLDEGRKKLLRNHSAKKLIGKEKVQ